LQVSWNIDCLNGENKMARVEEVCATVLETEPTPDVILLQVRTVISHSDSFSPLALFPHLVCM